MITEDYVSSETAKLLKEKGMDVSCFNHYVQKNNNDGTSEAVTVCTLQTAMKWLREKHNINIDIVPIWNKIRWEYQIIIITPQTAAKPYIHKTIYIKREQACEVAIKYCLENLI